MVEKDKSKSGKGKKGASTDEYVRLCSLLPKPSQNSSNVHAETRGFHLDWRLSERKHPQLITRLGCPPAGKKSGRKSAKLRVVETIVEQVEEDHASGCQMHLEVEGYDVVKDP
eukprot:1186369-Prorocentrum_minimum.AAC.4